MILKRFRAHRKRWLLLMLGIGLSLFAHIALLLLIGDPHPKHATRTQKVPVKLNIKEKKKAAENSKPDTSIPKTIIEAPLEPTDAPKESTRLGAQDHIAVKEQKTSPKMSLPGAPSSPLQNGPLHIKPAPPDKGGRIAFPKQQPKAYEKLLPKGDVVNLAHNDYIPDKNLPTGAVLDVSTTDYRFIGYFSAVRKLVEMAFTDIGPTLRSSPYIQGRLREVGQLSFQGESKVQLKVERSGLLTEARLVSSSGDKDIDAFWNKILNIAAPYPPLPKAYPDEQLSFTYTLYYDIVVQNDQRTRRFIY